MYILQFTPPPSPSKTPSLLGFPLPFIGVHVSSWVAPRHGHPDLLYTPLISGPASVERRRRGKCMGHGEVVQEVATNCSPRAQEPRASYLTTSLSHTRRRGPINQTSPNRSPRQCVHTQTYPRHPPRLFCVQPARAAPTPSSGRPRSAPRGPSRSRRRPAETSRPPGPRLTLLHANKPLSPRL